VKTPERFAVPWDEADLVDQVKAWLPEGQAMALRDKGMTELPWARLDARLFPCGDVMHARKGQDRMVACADQDGRVTPDGLFELGPMPPEAPARTHGTRVQGKSCLAWPRDAEQRHARKR